MPASTPAAGSLERLQELIAHHWGFETLRPLQAQAMQAVLERRDSLVVLPTGGGKSLCYQAPAVLRGGTTVVISPLIALMKDQVDGLRACGIAAAQLDSSLSAAERFASEVDLRQGAIRLLFVSPVRLVQSDLYRLLQQIEVHTFAIDEAHCISHWGHDFRPEYRQLSRLREVFPNATVHAYTATATERVRGDIAHQLALREPVVLVGNFDRPNLTYRVLPRLDEVKQVCEVVDRYPGEAGIIYCLRRRDVDALAMALQQRGYRVQPYHAGMLPEQRHAAQEAFKSEQCDIVVATVAFGMGIDRSNVRYVLHAAMPKSLEHYQQETGRAGRDGLAAECVLLYSGADVITFKAMLRKSAQEAATEAGTEVDEAHLASSYKHLEEMDRYSRGAVCRHRALVNYFGQAFDRPRCDACDLCLGDIEEVPEARTVAQKILSCVARVKEGFGIGHVVGILRGENSENIRKRGHEQLTTYGLLRGHSKADLRDWIYQLIGQGLLAQVGDEYPLLRLTDASWELMRGRAEVRLVQLVRRKKGERPQKSQADVVSWEDVDRNLFEALRGLRLELARERQVSSYLIFNDAVLREIARVRPSTMERMRHISGIGDTKLRDFGQRFLDLLADQCGRRGLSRDVQSLPPRPLFTPPAAPEGASSGAAPPPRAEPRSTSEDLAFRLFRDGAVLEDVMHQTERKRTTVVDYLAAFIRSERPASIARWVADDLYQRIAGAARQVGTERLKPIFLLLGEQVDYDSIRLVVAHLQAGGA
jgi:ATP-dependent DNA helicase RecQ